MKKAVRVATCIAALSAFTTVGAFAQTTGPASQDTMKQNGGMTNSGMTNSGMTSGGMDKSGTTGMSSGKMSKKKMSKGKSMSKDKSKMGGQSSSSEMKK